MDVDEPPEALPPALLVSVSVSVLELLEFASCPFPLLELSRQEEMDIVLEDIFVLWEFKFMLMWPTVDRSLIHETMFIFCSR